MISKIRCFFRDEWYYYKKRLTKKYYIINRSAGGAGFFSNYMWVLGHVCFARKLGYIPVVDMKNYKTLYSEDEPVDGQDNAWNYYFENVGEADLKEAYESKRFVMGRDMPLHRYEGRYCVGTYRFPTGRAVNHYAPIIEKNLKLKKETEELFEKEWSCKFAEGETVLGIHVRGTDMKNNLGHPLPAALPLYLKKAEELLKKHPEITTVFLATDESDTLEAFKEAFRDTSWRLVANDAFRARDDGSRKRVGVHEMQVENAREHHKYLLGREVLNDAYFLQKCDYLLCGHSNITNVVLLWNRNRFKKVVCLEADGAVFQCRDMPGKED